MSNEKNRKKVVITPDPKIDDIIIKVEDPSKIETTSKKNVKKSSQ
jgi:hypothetical protein